MRAVWLQEQALSIREIELPHPQPGEALIRVRLAGICATDLELVRGYYPFTGVPGHEFVGEVVEAPGAEHWAGQRVVGEINLTCGECGACKKGRPHHCERRGVLGILGKNGVFADYVTLPLKNLTAVPQNVPDERAVFTEPLAAALEIQEQVRITQEQSVLVIGAGRLGLLIAMTLALTGCDLAVAARSPKPAAILAGQRIVTTTIEDIKPGMYDVVVEATGSPEGFGLARQAVRPAGTIVLKSTYRGNLEVNLSAVVVDEITLVGSRCGPFAPALRLLEQGRIDPRPLIEASYRLEDWLAAFAHAGRRGVLKVLFDLR
jgi:threonine dehydrogenase-like Zn-dependent dehydrogenase